MPSTDDTIQAVATADLDKILRSKDVPDDVIEVYRKLKEFKDAQPRVKWIARRKEAWDAIENEMLTDTEKREIEDEKQTPLVINKINKGVQGSSAIVTDQSPEVKFHPIGSGDLYVAELLKRAHDVVWHKNEGLDETYGIVEETKIGGLGFFDVRHDPAKGFNPDPDKMSFGQIVFEEADPTTIYFDPKSRKRDFSDTDVIKAVKRSVKYVKEHYDGITDNDLLFELDLDDPQKSEGVTGEDNYTKDPDVIPDVEQEKRMVWEVEAWMLKTVKKYIADGEVYDAREEAQEAVGDDGEVDLMVIDTREQRIIVGKKLISKLSNPHGTDADGDPVMSLIGLRAQRTRTAYPMSPTSYALPLNKEKNKRRMGFIRGVVDATDAPIVMDDSSKWHKGKHGLELRVSNTATITPSRLQSGSANMVIYERLEDRADRDIDDQYDLQDVMRGKIPPGQDNIAGRTVLALQDMAGMMTKPFMRRLESSLIRLAEINIALILKHWVPEMWLQLIEDDEIGRWEPDEDKARREAEEKEPDEKGIQKKWKNALQEVTSGNLSLIDLDVRITAGSSMPTNRIAKMAVAIDLAKVGIYDEEAALEYIDDPNRDKILLRLKRRQEAAAQAELMKGAR